MICNTGRQHQVETESCEQCQRDALHDGERNLSGLDDFCRDHLLSPAERRALLGAIAGLSRYELASEIGCSPRTLETHWTRIFNKVGIRSIDGVLAALLRRLLWLRSHDALDVRVFPDMTRK